MKKEKQKRKVAQSHVLKLVSIKEVVRKLSLTQEKRKVNICLYFF